MHLSFRLCFAAVALAACMSPAWAVPIVDVCQVLPANNYWNTPIDQLPLHPSSATWINSVGPSRTLHPDWGNIVADYYGIPYIVVPSTEPLVTIAYDPYGYPAESDPGPYPIPLTAPVEGGPLAVYGDDRHVLAIRRSPSPATACTLYELYGALAQPAMNNWSVFSSAEYDLGSNALRPDTWTSADAAGLQIFPGLVRFDEANAGEIAHAIRFTANLIWGSDGSGAASKYLWPARHGSGNTNNPSRPPMGARFRLKSSFVIPASFDPLTKTILRAFMKYGLVLADGGSDWYFQGVTDTRWPDVVFSQLKSVTGNNFEVVDTALLQIDPNSALAVQVPGAPTIISATPRNGQATFSFTTPADGGAPIGGSATVPSSYPAYQVTCNPGGFIGTGTASPVAVSGLANGASFTCSVAASNVTGFGAASANVSVTPGQGVLSSPSPVQGFDNPINGSFTVTLTVTNIGSGSTSALSVSLTGPGAAPFSQTSTCSGQSLPSGGTCTIDLTFAPLVAGYYSASLTISGATTSPVTILLFTSAIAPPDAPVIGNGVPGNGQAWIFFAAPAYDGGNPISSYTATCLPAAGSVTATGNGSPILISGLSNIAYACSVHAANNAGNGPESTVVSVTPSLAPSLGLIGVQSRKFHPGVQNFDIAINSPVASNGPVSVEPRAIGAGHRIVFQFNNAINNPGSVTVVDAASASIGNATPSYLGSEVSVMLTGIPDNQRVTVSLANVNGAGVNAQASIGFLIGDVNNSRSVNASDISAVKARVGLTASGTNFRFDLNASGSITLQDVSAVKARSGLVLP